MKALWRLTLCFLLLGIAKSAVFVYQDIRLTSASAGWIMTKGRFVGLADVNNPPMKGKFKSDQIVEYEFEVGNQTYRGTAISFSRRTAWYLNEVKSLISELKSMPSLPIYYDPLSPSNSVLKPGGSNRDNIWFFCSQIFFIILLAMLILADFKKRKQV